MGLEINEPWHIEEGFPSPADVSVFNESGGLVAVFELREEAEHVVDLHNDSLEVSYALFNH